MVALHRADRAGLASAARWLLEKCGVIFDEREMLRRMKMVGANNMPAPRADRTFYFINDLADRAQGVQDLQSTDGVAV